MSKTTWADLVKGDAVEMRGRTWTVAKIKHKGKRSKVTLERDGQTASSEVRSKDPVAKVKVKAPKLHDTDGAQQRWATESESITAEIGPGDPEQRTPPVKPGKTPWETPADRIESKLDELLAARLVGEGTDAQGYYVPPVDASTVAAHLLTFHGMNPSDFDESAWLTIHDEQHEQSLAGKLDLATVHWHTETRPKSA